MGLDSAVYLLFLGCVAGIHAMLAERWRVLALLGASLIFYAASSPNYLALMLCLSGLNYAAVLGLSRISDQHRRTLLFAGIVAINLTALILFKYLAGSLTEILVRFGWHAQAAGPWHLVTPLGLSLFHISNACVRYRCLSPDLETHQRFCPVSPVCAVFSPDFIRAHPAGGSTVATIGRGWLSYSRRPSGRSPFDFLRTLQKICRGEPVERICVCGFRDSARTRLLAGAVGDHI